MVLLPEVKGWVIVDVDHILLFGHCLGKSKMRRGADGIGKYVPYIFPNEASRVVMDQSTGLFIKVGITEIFIYGNKGIGDPLKNMGQFGCLICYLFLQVFI